MIDETITNRLWLLTHSCCLSQFCDYDKWLREYTSLLERLTASEANVWKVFNDYCGLLEDLCFIVIKGDGISIKGFVQLLNEDLAIWPNDPLWHEKNENGVYVIPPINVQPYMIDGSAIEYPLWNNSGLGSNSWLNTCFISTQTSASALLTIPNITKLFGEGIIKHTRTDFLCHIKAITETLRFTHFIGFSILKGDLDYFVFFFQKDNYDFVRSLSEHMEVERIPHIFFFHVNCWCQRHVGKLFLPCYA
jgi:hypothetical protein